MHCISRSRDLFKQLWLVIRMTREEGPCLMMSKTALLQKCKGGSLLFSLLFSPQKLDHCLKNKSTLCFKICDVSFQLGFSFLWNHYSWFVWCYLMLRLFDVRDELHLLVIMLQQLVPSNCTVLFGKFCLPIGGSRRSQLIDLPYCTWYPLSFFLMLLLALLVLLLTLELLWYWY